MLSPVPPVNKGSTSGVACSSIFHILLQFSANIAIAASSGYYLTVGTESIESITRDRTWFCNSNYNYVISTDGKFSTINQGETCNKVNVYDRFTVVLKLYFALSIIAAILLLMSMMALCCFRCKNYVSGGFIALITGFCTIGTCCYSFACLIILHVYRYQASGKYASLDWMTGEQLAQLKTSDP